MCLDYLFRNLGCEMCFFGSNVLYMFATIIFNSNCFTILTNVLHCAESQTLLLFARHEFE